MHITIIVKKQIVKKKKEKKQKKNTTAQIGTNVRARRFGAGLLARCPFASGRSLVPEQMLSWYPNSTLHCMLPMQPSQW
jgi:hypothetical protein